MSNKIRTKKVIKVQKKLTLNESVKHIGDRVDRFMKVMDAKAEELVKKHNELATGLVELHKVQQQIATFAASEFGKVLGQQQTIAMELGKSIDHLDVNVLALAEVSKEVFGQLQQVDHILQNATIIDGVLVTDIMEADTAKIKEAATKWYTDIVASAFKIVMGRRQDEELLRASAKEQAASDKTEAERAEQELRVAESAGILSQSAGGAGAGIPFGADVYGG